ncbi:MAG: uroporphyrinogen decarboxylase [Actinomycetota bacterium]|nr:uroporphyrinogen decarboxylase [Actinomycetota bacterium]
MDRIPVWFMRQAGRSLPEYRRLKEDHSILDLCRKPDLATEVTLQPVRRLGVDAAILFSDIVVPLMGLGIEVDIVPGVGPVFGDPLREKGDVDRVRQLDAEADVPFVLETIRQLVTELEVPLIGFSGAPFTLACYLIEGGPSKDHARTKALMYSDPSTWSDLMMRLAEMILAYARAQVAAGAQAIQLFDSWIGVVGRDDFDAHVKPAVAHILDGLQDLDVPRIYFGLAAGELLSSFGSLGADVIGIDWRIPLDEARERIGSDVAVQGNLDPATCLASTAVLDARAQEVLRRGGGAGHVFNLGHGVLPQTDPAVLSHLVELVHDWNGDG